MSTLLSINNYHYRRGGADAVYLEHDALFRKAGWNTVCFAMTHPKNRDSEFKEYFVDEIEFGRAYSLSTKAAMAAKIIYSGEAKRKLAGLIDSYQPDIAHVHCVYHHISPSVLPVLRKRGIPVVLTAHDLKILCPAYTMLSRGSICERCSKGAVWNAVLRRCIKDSVPLSALIALESGIHRLLGIYRRNVDKLVAPSRFYQQKFHQNGWPDEQLAYVPNYVRIDEFSPSFAPGNYFVYIGRLSYEKGIATLCNAASEAGVNLVVVGDGPLREVLTRQTASFGKIRFTGYQSGEALRNWIRNARAVVLPSEWYENAPISVLEAYASGKPVIGARIGGIPELIEEGETGWLFGSGQAAELRDVLSHVDSLSAERISAAGKAAREVAERRHSPERYLNSMEDLYGSMGVRAKMPAIHS